MLIASLLKSPLLSLPLRNANFAIYSAGSGISLVGMWMQRIAIGWLTWQLTDSGLWLGIVAFADFFPVLLIGPIAGAAADRWDRLRVVKTSQTISMVQATVLFVLTATGHMNIGLLVTLTAFQGVVVAFNQPARLALVPSLVSSADIASAMAINAVYSIWPASSARCSRACDRVVRRLGRVRSQRPELRRLPGGAGEHSPHRDVWRTAKRESFGADLRAGIRYTAAHPGIASLLWLLIALGVGGRPLNELLPGFAADVFHSGAGGLSILASAIGGGAILGGVWLGHRGISSGLTWVALGGSLVGALATIARSRPNAFGLPCRPWWSLDLHCRRPESRSRRRSNSPPTGICAGASWDSMA